MEKRIIENVKKIFEVHYGIKLDFQCFSSLSKEEFLLWSKCERSFVYFKSLKKAYFPVFSSQKYLKALIVVQPVLKKDCLKEMSYFFDLTVRESLRLNERCLEQNQKEDILKRLITDPKKVIPFKVRC